MSLLAAQALMNNKELQDRLQSAIRQEAAARLAWAEPDASLARAGYTAPDTVAASFMIKLATNTEISAAACDACGHAGPVPDDTIKWIVGDSWTEIATEIYGPPEPPPTT